MSLYITSENSKHVSFEMAERKGAGHPDSICDDVAEEISKNLCRYYLDQFGIILHHNVDKALLVGGESEPVYGGGKVLKPISFIIAGRATMRVKDKMIPVQKIAEETTREWFSKNIRHIDSSKHIEISAKIRHGSSDLTELFARAGKNSVPLANDTSFGAGYYPLTELQRNILKIENLLNSSETKSIFPFTGEDVKVMGVRKFEKSFFTIAIAIVDRYISDINDYAEKIELIKRHILSKLNSDFCEIQINTADDYKKESVYLTTTGTSAESGDDGQIGRGNRINGLITPYFPMSLEAASGKNPVSHIGKIYNHFAMHLSRGIVENKFADTAKVYIVSQIGKPINNPQLLHLSLENQHAEKKVIEDFISDRMKFIMDFSKLGFA